MDMMTPERRLHPLVAKTAAALRKAKPDDNELLRCTGFYVRVAPESVDRAIEVLASVVDAMIASGLSFKLGEDKRPIFLFEGEQLCIEIREDRTRRDYTPTKQEQIG